jgi:peptidoglycan/LPS O-acetylase OafA/YrhL
LPSPVSLREPESSGTGVIATPVPADKRASDNKSFVSIQVLRGIAALLVVLLHLSGREALCKNVPHILYPFSSELIGFYAVDTFFIISGFVMCTAHFNDFAQPGRIKVFAQKRFIRLFPFYWLTCIPLLFFKHLPLNSKLLCSLALVPSYAGRINTVAWTLAYELMFLVVFAICLKFPRKNLPYFMAAWFLTIVVANALHPPVLKDLGYFEAFISPYNIDFLLGMALALLVQHTKLLPHKPFILVGLVWLVLATPCKACGFWLNGPFDHIVAITLPSFLIAYGLLALEQQKDVRFPTPFVLLGDASYSVYLVHYVIIDALALTWTQIGSSYAIIPWSLATATVIPFVCVCTYLFVEKPIFEGLRKRFIKKPQKSLSVQRAVMLDEVAGK